MVHIKLDESRGQTLSVEVDASATTEDALALLAQAAAARHGDLGDLDGFSLVFAGQRLATGLGERWRVKGLFDHLDGLGHPLGTLQAVFGPFTANPPSKSQLV
jgi:hypothetical protein